ncbi:MAG: hypothetical protein ACKO9H_10415, partial [Planctomycetota bacterium]
MNQSGDEQNQAANELKLSQQMLFGEETTGANAAESNLAQENSSHESSETEEVENSEAVLEGEAGLEVDNLEANDAESAETTEQPAETVGSRLPAFAALGLSDKVLEALVKSGYEQPTPIQAAIIPEMLAGRDVLAQSQTGS